VIDINKIMEEEEITDYDQEKMYLKGAVYASMSGSGSTVFGIFKEKPIWESNNNEVFFIQEKNQSKV
jgi:4-diphosphocytidyl-2C-methyl-D-erythritol kinase